MRTFCKVLSCVLLTACGSGSSTDTTPLPPPPATITALPEFSSNAQLSYLSAFIRLTAQLRFHHPGDGAAGTDWDELMLEAAYLISSASSSADAEARIWQLLSPIMPDLQLNGKGTPIAALNADTQVRVWQQNAYTEIEEPDLVRRRVTYAVSAIRQHPDLPQNPVWRYDDALLHAAFAVMVPTTGDAQGTPYTKSARFELPHDLTHSAVCVATVAKVWSVIDQFFPYFQDNKDSWQQQLSPLLQSCAQPDRNAMYRQLYLSLQTLDDAHIDIVSPKLAAWHGSFVTPVRFAWLENKLVAVAKKPGSSTRIQLGDELISVNNIAAASYVSSLYDRAVANNHIRRDQVTSHHLLRGASGSAFELTLKDATGALYQETQTATETVSFAKSAIANFFAPVGLSNRFVSSDVYYIDAARLQPADYATALTTAKTAKAVVVDLRGYPQYGELYEQLLPAFCRQAPIVSNPVYFVHANANEPNQRYRNAINTELAPLPTALQQPVVGLVGRFSLSSSEHAISYLKRCNVPFVGETSVGANGDTTRISIFKAYPAAYTYLPFTAIQVTQPDGSLFHGVGIQPTLQVAPSINGLRTQQDEQLQSAITLAKSMIH